MTEKPNARMLCLLLITILLVVSSSLGSNKSAAERATAAQLRAIQKYIKQSWHTLTRSSAQLARAAPDPKFKAMPDGRCLCMFLVKRVSNQSNSACAHSCRQQSLPPSRFGNCLKIGQPSLSMACFIFPTLTLCRVDDSTKCMAGTVISLK